MGTISIDIGLLLLRLCLGLTMCAHGLNKIFAGGRIAGTGRWFDSIGMKPGVVHARVAAGAEIAAGLGLAFGFLVPISCAGFVALMIVAGWTVHRDKGFFIVNGGWEYNLVLALGAIGLAMVGAGRISVDWEIWGNDMIAGWWGLLVAAVVGLAGGIGQLMIFYRPDKLHE